jgi:hypothetical protein
LRYSIQSAMIQLTLYPLQTLDILCSMLNFSNSSSHSSCMSSRSSFPLLWTRNSVFLSPCKCRSRLSIRSPAKSTSSFRVDLGCSGQPGIWTHDGVLTLEVRIRFLVTTQESMGGEEYNGMSERNDTRAAGEALQTRGCGSNRTLDGRTG